jgi:hypothetical protein
MKVLITTFFLTLLFSFASSQNCSQNTQELFKIIIEKGVRDDDIDHQLIMDSTHTDFESIRNKAVEVALCMKHLDCIPLYYPSFHYGEDNSILVEKYAFMYQAPTGTLFIGGFQYTKTKMQLFLTHY